MQAAAEEGSLGERLAPRGQSSLPSRAIWPRTACSRFGHLRVGGCDVLELAQRFGTPLFVIDEDTFRDACKQYRIALRTHYPGRSAVHYAAKSFLNTAIAQLVCAEGLGIDVASDGELYIATSAGTPPGAIHFHGNAKSRAEIQEAVRLGVGRIIVETLDEIEQLGEVLQQTARSVEISLRIAPEVAAPTHAHIQTGHRESKFGFSLESVEAALAAAASSPAIRVTGLHFHLGSQIANFECYERGVEVALELTLRLRALGVEIEELSPGGGLSVPYIDSDPACTIDAFVEAIARAVNRAWSEHDLPLPRLVLEPGRSISARAGVALYSIVGTKHMSGSDSARRYLHLDGGMADNIRPALYGARYTAVVANRLDAPRDEVVHLSGRYCESSDILVKDVLVPSCARRGDLIAIPAAGAYTLSMASNYNGARRPEVVLVAHGKIRSIQRRETLAELVARDFSLGADQ